VTTFTASDGRSPGAVAAETAAGRETGIGAQPKPGGRSPLRTMLGLLDDAVLLLLLVLLIPLVIVLLGMPVALLVRLLVEIAQRL
jgi:hypothetical protein